MSLARVLLAFLIGFSILPSANAQEEADTLDYCVREGGFPGEGYEESDYPNCIWVDRIEEVPKGATWLPSHGGLDDPEAIRRYWCLDHPDDELPSPESVEARCLRFFADEYGGRYADALRPEPTVHPEADVHVQQPPALDLPGISIESTPTGHVLQLPALSLPFPTG